jgi:hypothetical protein
MSGPVRRLTLTADRQPNSKRAFIEAFRIPRKAPLTAHIAGSSDYGSLKLLRRRSVFTQGVQSVVIGSHVSLTTGCSIQSKRWSENSKWEDVDHEDSLAGHLAGPAGSVEGEGDPLGLGAFVECVHTSINDMEKLIASYWRQCERPGHGISFVHTSPRSASVPCVAYSVTTNRCCYPHDFQVFRSKGFPLCSSPKRHVPRLSCRNRTLAGLH